MKNAIHVGNEGTDNKENIFAIAAAITQIFVSAKDTNMDQETVRVSLGVIKEIAQVSGTTTTNSTFAGDKVVNMGDPTTPEGPEGPDRAEE